MSPIVRILTLLGGALVGVLMAALIINGNPGNMGICGACFTRDIAGALGLHAATTAQYLRPEVLGVILGAFAAAVLFREFRPRGGSSPLLKFILGAWVTIGALVFLGCPFRAIQRLGGGDLNAVFGIAGLLGGIALGMVFTRRGFNTGRATPQPAVMGFLMPAMAVALFAALLFGASAIRSSVAGVGSLRAPVWLGFGLALVAGVILQRTRFCTLGAFRGALFYRDPQMLWTLFAIVVAYGVTLAIGGKFKLGMENQPIAHTNSLWNFGGMVLVGLTGSMLGGCPVRLFVLSGEGNSDAAAAILGMIAGGALAHNLNLASAPQTATSAGGPTTAGMIAVGIGVAFCIIIGVWMRNGAETQDA
jgi:YedE family putative selenium metabolism protein